MKQSTMRTASVFLAYVISIGTSVSLSGAHTPGSPPYSPKRRARALQCPGAPERRTRGAETSGRVHPFPALGAEPNIPEPAGWRAISTQAARVREQKVLCEKIKNYYIARMEKAFSFIKIFYDTVVELEAKHGPNTETTRQFCEAIDMQLNPLVADFVKLSGETLCTSICEDIKETQVFKYLEWVHNDNKERHERLGPARVKNCKFEARKKIKRNHR